MALLRAVNVGGTGLVKMTVLAEAFQKLGFREVKTFIQSGNVLFTADQGSPDELARFIEEGLAEQLGLKTRVVLLTADDLRTIIDSEPFKDHEGEEVAMQYVTFYTEAPTLDVELPWRDPKGEGMSIALVGSALFSVSLIVDGKRGMLSLPKGALAKAPSTTRNWNTVRKLLVLLDAKDGPV